MWPEAPAGTTRAEWGKPIGDRVARPGLWPPVDAAGTGAAEEPQLPAPQCRGPTALFALDWNPDVCRTSGGSDFLHRTAARVLAEAVIANIIPRTAR